MARGLLLTLSGARKVREEINPTDIPHAKLGAPKCGGFLYGRTFGETAGIVCNECFEIVQMVSPGDLARVLADMALAARGGTDGFRSTIPSSFRSTPD
jgi:hypothetical protein